VPEEVNTPPGIMPGGVPERGKIMGIRVSKKIGWGLTDIQHENGRITDPRINVSSHLLMPPDSVGPPYLEYLGALADAEVPESYDHTDILLEAEMVKEALKREGGLPWPITWQSEYGRADTLLVQPVAALDWSRHDDPIDFIEESFFSRPMDPRVFPIRNGIHPYEGLYMDGRSGKRLDSSAVNIMRRVLAREDGKPERRQAADSLALSLGFSSADEAQSLIIPFIPGDIRRVAAWGDLFSGPTAWLDLRPLLYVYWA
jgi:hypothetical protein